MGREELSRLTDEFLAKGGTITKCPTGYPTGEPISFSDRLGDNVIDDDDDYVVARYNLPSMDIGEGCKRYLPARYD